MKIELDLYQMRDFGGMLQMGGFSCCKDGHEDMSDEIICENDWALEEGGFVVH